MESGQDYCKVGSIICINFFSFAAAAAFAPSSSFSFSFRLYFSCVSWCRFVCLADWLPAISKKNILYAEEAEVLELHAFILLDTSNVMSVCAACLLTFFSPHFNYWTVFFVVLKSHSFDFFYCQTLDGYGICIGFSLRIASAPVNVCGNRYICRCMI